MNIVFKIAYFVILRVQVITIEVFIKLTFENQ